MHNVHYIVSFEVNPELNDQMFDFREEALNYAKENIDLKPTVEVADVTINDDGTHSIDDTEVIFDYHDTLPVEESCSEELKESNVDVALAAFEASLGEDWEKDLKDLPGEDVPTDKEKSAQMLAQAAAEHDKKYPNYFDTDSNEQAIKDLASGLGEDFQQAKFDFEKDEEVPPKSDLRKAQFDFEKDEEVPYEDEPELKESDDEDHTAKTVADDKDISSTEYTDAGLKESDDEEWPEPEDDVKDAYEDEGVTPIEDTVEVSDDVVEDPFSTEFDVTPVEYEDDEERPTAEDFTADPVDFLQELADALGIGDQVEITPVETPEIPEVSEDEDDGKVGKVDVDAVVKDIEVKDEEPEDKEEKKFPDPDKHELVDTVDGVDIYHCKKCGKYSAIIDGKKVKKDSIDELKDVIKNGKDADDRDELEEELASLYYIYDKHNRCTVKNEAGERLAFRSRNAAEEYAGKNDLYDYQIKFFDPKNIFYQGKEVSYKIVENIDEYYEPCCAIKDETEYKGIDNQVVPCKTYTIISHSEDEKPVDCKMEKKPLEKPLTENEEDDMTDEEFIEAFGKAKFGNK